MQKLQELCTKANLLTTLSKENGRENILTVEATDFSFTAMRIENSYMLQSLICVLPNNKREKEQLCQRICGLQLARLKHEAQIIPICNIYLQNEQVLLQCRIDKSLLEHELYDNLENFCNALETWKDLTKQNISRNFKGGSPMRQGIISPTMLG